MPRHYICTRSEHHPKEKLLTASDEIEQGTYPDILWPRALLMEAKGGLSLT